MIKYPSLAKITCTFQRRIDMPNSLSVITLYFQAKKVRSVTLYRVQNQTENLSEAIQVELSGSLHAVLLVAVRVHGA